MVTLRKIKKDSKTRTITGHFLTTNLSNKRQVKLGKVDDKHGGGYYMQFKKRRRKKDSEHVRRTKSMQTLYFTLSNEAMETIACMYVKLLKKQVQAEEKTNEKTSIR